MKQPIWFKQLELGPMQNYVYLLGDPTTHEAAVVDAAWDIDAIVETAEAEGYRITHDLVTHFHPDHLGGDFMGHNVTGAAELHRATCPSSVVLHKAEMPFVHRITGLSDIDVLAVEGGDEIRVGKLTVKLLHTPGHTPGSQCFLVGERGRLRRHALHRFLRARRPAGLEPRRHVPQPARRAGCPARRHAALPRSQLRRPASTSTIGDEKRTNPLMRFRTLNDFLAVMSPLRP